MKKTKKTYLLIMLLAAIGTSVLANSIETRLGESSKFSVLSKSDPDKFNLIYMSEKEGPVTIKIMNADGDLVSIEIIKRKKYFRKIYDFKNLPEGNYTFEVKNEEGSGSQLIAYDPYKQKLNMVVTSTEKNKYKVLVAGFTPTELVTVRIYNEEGRIVKEDEIKTHRNFTRVYDLANIESRQFTFTAASGHESILKVKKNN